VVSETAGQDRLLGQTLGHYRIVQKIGAGGMGEVYCARDEHLARDVAIKVLPPGTLIDESARKHFRKEALILSQLNHPNVATIHDFDTQQGVDFLVMEYIPGITLSEKLGGGPLPEKETLHLGVQLAEGLAAAHEHGVVHRDLKPGNLRLTADGRLKILDFGLAKLRHPVAESAVTESFTESRATAGTLPYMAPEQVLGGEIDERTDIHGAGSVLYEMATGRRPFADVESAQLIGAILHRAPRSPTALNPRLSPELERIIGKCLEMEPGNRYQSANELAIDLRRLQTGVQGGLQPGVKPGQWSSAEWVGLGAGILATVIVLLIALNMGGLRELALGRAAAPHIESLAVLPIANLSGDPQQEYFADGMTEELITNLGKIGALRVISRTSVMQYKQTVKTVPTIAQELKVDAVVEGSVSRSGNRVRITAQLIQAKAERQLWVESYERDVSDILALQSEVAREIAKEIQIKVTPQEQARLAGAPAVNPEAYRLYLQGRYQSFKRTVPAFEKSILLFQQALEKDPNNALAYAGLAESYGLLPFYGGASPKEAFPKAKAAALKALEHDSSIAEAHAALGFVLFYGDWDWAAAEREFTHAIELNPSYVMAHHWYAEYLSAMGRHDQAIAEIKLAQELDPLSPLLLAIAGEVCTYARRYDEAIEQSRKALELDSNFALAHENLALGYLGKRMYEDFAAEYEKAERAYGNPGGLRLARADALSGKRGEALKILGRVKEQSSQPGFDFSGVASVYLALGEQQKALDWLEKAYEERDPYAPFWNVNPRLDPLRSEPRFQDILRRMNFPK
jgi:eukaryotic-like serine/threonine-protein kinase